MPFAPPRPPPAAALLLLLLVASSCGNDPLGLCEAQVRARCEIAFRCCNADERLENNDVLFADGPDFFAGDLTYATSEGECFDRGRASCAFVGPLNDSVALGRIAFDGAAAGECLSALNGARDACNLAAFTEAAADPEGPCNNTTTGLVKGGDACALSAECADGGTCDLGDLRDPKVDEELDSVDGECITPGVQGDPCDSDLDCAEGFLCRQDAGGNAICQELPGDGEPCLGLDCAEGLSCSFAGGPGVCVPPPGVGEPCPDFACVDGAFCDTSLVPAACAAQGDAGDPCDGPQECLSGDCNNAVDPAVCVGGDEPPDICTGKTE